ncbi:MAG: hypothetical protein A2381_11575 [Bdellovibrionales bacterium RIFOXYB1_FULL_37_110]|nr:MAG: hypothetical protein A2417_11880 [Bdellovibrionales bacterium RIFOXYC1_FULL_37_79]OFZ57330.1 MAG: hypothetical protein A2381_11575 [Bdellovibrionales bacterium RIFOXYB1_FULL_37_110]OFZ62226.1 MAG: hypothetical protein A2577_14125 [Bdellovibrionales bacterium RIFOXYD1_FULL_36_51]
MKRFENLLESVVFASRWIQIPIYLGLMVSTMLYTYKFLLELIYLCKTVNTISAEVMMIGVLTLIDISMVSNLLIMVIVGGYATFVSKLDLNQHEDKPDWLERINPGTLKVKLAAAMAGISGIHLLKSFIDIGHKQKEQVTIQIIIHLVFLISAIMLAFTEKILQDSHLESEQKK